MIIGACGFGSTGSSAVCDYLMEFGNVQVLDRIEFTWVSCVDGLIDLEYHLMHPHNRTADSISAIGRLRRRMKSCAREYEKYGGIPHQVFEQSVEKFIESITTVSWDWYDNENQNLWNKYIGKYVFQNRIIPKIEKKVGHQIHCYPMKKVELSVMPGNFYDAARLHVKELLQAMGATFDKPIILDQPFSGNNPQASFPFFEDPYAFVVDRDPRDNYIFSKTRLLGRNHFMAVENVEDFIKYYRAIRANQPYRNGDKRVLPIQFEEMVYDYDIATKKIREFLNLPENPAPKSIFDPSMSIANTQTFKRFPQFADDIRRIEEELPEFLFDFSKYPEPDLSGEMFFGRSPKNKG
jgi:hypothetical protein